jgi:hypothetical protein
VARKYVALLASMLKFVCESEPKASGLLLILVAAASRDDRLPSRRITSMRNLQG